LRDILKCISTIDEFNAEEYNRLNIGVEIQDFTEPNLSEEEIASLVKRYKELFKGFNKTKSMHGPFLDLKPSSPDEDIRRVSFNKYLRTLKIATELDMDYVVFHSQINPFLNQPILVELNNQQSREAWHSLINESIDYKGIIVIENIFEESPYMIKELIEIIGLPNIKINFDIGHARLGNVSLENWIKELKDYIAYVHLHSNDGVHDLHQIPSDIEISVIVKLLDKYGIDPVIALEYKTKDASREIELLRK